MKFKFLKHTADIKFKAYGKTIEEVFENSAIALRDSITSEKVKEVKNLKFKVKGKDFEEMLYNFLEEFLFLIDSQGFLVSRAEVKIRGKEISANVFGDDVKNYETDNDIKAITYNEMFVRSSKGVWEAQVVVDV